MSKYGIIRLIFCLVALTPWVSFEVMCGLITAHAETLSGYRQDTPADYQLSNKLYNNLPGSLQTPCIRWADPFMLGKLKILIILPASAAWEGSELQERLSTDISMITVKSRKEWGEPKAEFYSLVPVGDEITSTARMKLSTPNRYDVIIIGKVQWTIIPEEIRQLILGKAKSGTGLVFVDPWDVEAGITNCLSPAGATNAVMDLVRQTVPISNLPLDMDFEKLFTNNPYTPRRIGPMEIRVGKMGEGMVASLDYKDTLCKDDGRMNMNDIALTPFLQDDPLFYDYYHSILAKIILLAAGKDPGIDVISATQNKTVERTKLPGTVAEFKLLTGNEDDREYQLYYEIRDRQNRVVQSGKKSVTLGKSGLSFTPDIPMLKPGLYMADLWVRDGSKAVNWASTSFTVTDTSYVEGVYSDKEYFQRNEKITGKVKFKAQPARGLDVAVELWDTYDRLIQTASLNGEGRFEFQKINNPLSRTYRIQVQIKEKQFILDEGETWVGLPSSAIDDFQFIIWADGLNQRKNKITMAQCKRYGLTGYYDCTTWVTGELARQSADALARNNLVAYPYCGGLWDFCIAEREDRSKGFCYGKLAETIQVLTTKVYPPKINAYKRYGAMAYSICEENFIGKDEHLWNNPEAMKDYHACLKNRYGDISRLNEIWGSSFKDFPEITKVSFMEAKTGGQYSRWFEQERHKQDRFSEVHEAVIKNIQELDPAARVALDVSGLDFDYPRMSKNTGIRAMTQCILEHFINKTRGDLIGTFIGYYSNTMDEYSMRIPPWQYAFQGGTHMAWWPVSFAFTPDLSEPLLIFKQCSEEMEELKSGIGKLLMSSRKRIDPIFMLWSNESKFAGILNPMDITCWDSILRFDNLLRRIGLDYVAVGPEYVENQLKFDENHRVLILPNCQAVSRKQAERICDFVKAGGLVIADFIPATMDEYLRPYGQKAAAAEAISSAPCATCKGKGRFEDGNMWVTCPKCGGTGKIVKGGNVAVKSILEDVFDFSQKGVKSCGKGYGLFFKGFPDKKEEWGGIRKLLTDKGGIKSDIEALDKLGNLRADIRWYVFDNARARYLGILPDLMVAEPPGQEITLRLKEKSHVYNVRANRYLGFLDQVKIGVEPANAKLLAFYPAKIEGLDLTLSSKKYHPGDAVKLKLVVQPKSLKDSMSVVRVEVRKGERRVDCFTKNIAFQGEGVHPIPLALNQEKGEYIIHCREVIAGYTEEISFEVK